MGAQVKEGTSKGTQPLIEGGSLVDRGQGQKRNKYLEKWFLPIKEQEEVQAGTASASERPVRRRRDAESCTKSYKTLISAKEIFRLTHNLYPEGVK